MERRLLGYIKKNDLMNKIKSNCLRHDALITFKPDYDSGMFYKQTIFKKSGDKETGLIPLHTKGPMSDVKGRIFFLFLFPFNQVKYICI